ncbi:nickel ABC transporter permease (plasmid) [Pseudalkalibacillus hwajinpoensis]|uniref:nickel ABC transporter permease n=1 Tax=Guptibacillus hwajinpoensis TaxID=208199 RepID=UPI00325BFF71
MGMARQVFRIVGKRIFQLVLTILILSFVTFLMMKLTPGDPVRTILKVEDMETSVADEEELREAYGFNDPLPIQYGQWLWKAAQGDLGASFITKRPVLDMLMSRLPATLGLTFGGLLVLFVIVLPLGIIGAVYKDRWPDTLSKWFALAGASIPSFWLGLLLIHWFSLELGLLPVMGTGTWAHFVLPSVTLGVAMAPMYIRLLRERLIQTMNSPYIEAAAARGVKRGRILIRHVLRGSLMSVVTLFGLSVGGLLGGVTVVEILFSWPGMGELIVQAVSQRDYPVVQGYILIIGVIVIVVNLLVDLLYTLLNPEIRYGKEEG